LDVIANCNIWHVAQVPVNLAHFASDPGGGAKCTQVPIDGGNRVAGDGHVVAMVLQEADSLVAGTAKQRSQRHAQGRLLQPSPEVFHVPTEEPLAMAVPSES
jgi:hypothetical protein